MSGLQHGLTLQALPASLNILPLYIFLLALFPLIFGLMRISASAALLSVMWIVDLREPRPVDQSVQLAGWAELVFRSVRLAIFVRYRRVWRALLLRRYDGNLPSMRHRCVPPPAGPIWGSP